MHKKQKKKLSLYVIVFEIVEGSSGFTGNNWTALLQFQVLKRIIMSARQYIAEFGGIIMSIERVRAYFQEYGMEPRILELAESSATVELAAAALGCEPERIAKTLSFRGPEGPLLVVAAGDARIDNQKFKAAFGFKAKMLTPEEAEELVGHRVGGVCPFGVNPGVTVYLDESLHRFETVFPACGSGNSAIELTIPELERYSNSLGWMDVCKGWNGA